MKNKSRFWNSNDGAAKDPFITGYVFVKFENLPLKMTKVLEPEAMLNSLAMSVKIPKTNEEGTMYNDPMTIKFLELADIPIYNIIDPWFRGPYKEGTNMYYWTTSPNGKNVSFYAKFNDVKPMVDIRPQYSSDISDNSKLEINVDFEFKNMDTSEEIGTHCCNFVNQYFQGYQTISDKNKKALDEEITDYIEYFENIYMPKYREYQHHENTMTMLNHISNKLTRIQEKLGMR